MAIMPKFWKSIQRDLLPCCFSFLSVLVTGGDATYCVYSENGEVVQFDCGPHRCCGRGCCISPAFGMYRIWYFWIMFFVMLAICSGGGWWYRGRGRRGAYRGGPWFLGARPVVIPTSREEATTTIAYSNNGWWWIKGPDEARGPSAAPPPPYSVTTRPATPPPAYSEAVAAAEPEGPSGSSPEDHPEGPLPVPSSIEGEMPPPAKPKKARPHTS